jgi:hypothetical protein
MPTPITFKKHIILWVDDHPVNNKSTIKDIRRQSNESIEILLLTSTKMVEDWMRLFSWILVWSGVQFKIISDMVRDENKGPNYFAGIDLLELFYNRYGYTTPILIYCQAVVDGRQNAKKRKVRR